MSKAPKRFYREVSLLRDGERFAVALDGRPAKTVGRVTLAAPKALAEALAAEWSAQGDTIAMEAMPLTRIHGFVLDAGEEGRRTFVDTIVQYAASDLLCYREDKPDLAARQDRAFAPFLAKAYADGLRFSVTTGLLPVDQPQSILETLRVRMDGMALSEVFPRKLLTEITGSAILALYAETDPEGAFAAARWDETVQAETWGEDAEAAAREANLRRDFDAALHYLALQAEP